MSGSSRDRLPILGISLATTVVVAMLGVPLVIAIAIGAGLVAASALTALTSYVRWSLLAVRARAELRDPAGPLLGLLVGAATIAAGGSVLAALVAFVAVLAVKVTAGMALRAPAARPRLPAGSAAAVWLDRAEGAVDAIGRIGPGGASPLAERFVETHEGVRDTLVLIHRLAAQELVVSQVIAGIDPRTTDELHRLEDERAGASTAEMREEIGRAVEAVRDQIAARDRLVSTDRTLLARMRTAALGLEGLVARLGEIAVLAQGGANTTANARVSELADELEALRTGLTEADSLARAAVGMLGPTNSAMEALK
ncbi:MAG: hypothetical protein M3T56_15290 [Chloroflexota bacterium]|nr:hypothetical protein [Chloroflexota bacterium]